MPSDLQVDNIKDGSATKTLAEYSSSAWSWGSGVPAGSILQVKSTIVTARNSSTDYDTSGTGADCGLNVTINPIKKTGSHFYIIVSIGLGTVTSSDSWAIVLSRDGTRILNGVDSSNRNGIFVRGIDHAGHTGTDVNHGVGAMNHGVDTSGGTAGASTTFKAGLVTQQSSSTAYINRTEGNDDVLYTYGSYTSSSITVMEIAQ